MANIENIINHKFKKGQSGNPLGYKKGVKNRATILRIISNISLERKNPLSKETEVKSAEEFMNLVLYAKALDGDISAIKEVNDTLYGKLQDSAKIDASISVEYSKLTKAERRKRIAELTQKLLKK
jgi:hypothetical protein